MGRNTKYIKKCNDENGKKISNFFLKQRKKDELGKRYTYNTDSQTDKETIRKRDEEANNKELESSREGKGRA